VNELSADVPAPAVSNVQLCSGGEALISANNPSATTVYRLYDGQSSLQPIDEKLGGRFKIAVPAGRSFYISQMNGTCESPRSEMQVTVGLSTLNIPNAFTPNGDGINDTWKIPGMEITRHPSSRYLPAMGKGCLNQRDMPFLLMAH
jgi:hypothetical protein